MGSGVAINLAIKKYGIENFVMEILIFFDTYKKALLFEKYVVDENLISKPSCYNAKPGGIGGGVLRQSNETIKKRVSKIRGRIQSDEERQARSLAKIEFYKNPENRRLASEKSKGISKSESHKKNMLGKFEAGRILDPLIEEKRLANLRIASKKRWDKYRESKK